MKYTKQFQYGEHTVTLETGVVARQADAAVMVRMADTMVLVTVVYGKTADASRDFFPLTVNYQDKFYAAGRIPGGYLKREGRPTERETLISRLIDRPIRPLFPKGFVNEVQVVATVLSYDPAVDPDIPAMIGTSAALSISGVPFAGPIAAAKVGHHEGQYILNPSQEQLETSALDLVVAGTQSAVLMVESEAQELHEDIMLGGVLFGHQQMQVAIDAINELKAEVNKPTYQWTPTAINETLLQQIQTSFEQPLREAYFIREKLERYSRVNELRQQALEQFVSDGETAVTADEVAGLFNQIEKSVVRNKVLAGEERIDGRSHRAVRPITIQNGLLPRVHGSALFTRGETQAIVTTTLGTKNDAKFIDELVGEGRENFMLHYNFPPYCVGETGMMTGPKRREIGHGRLARRGLQAVLPQGDDFPYVIRVVSEITESNGSSSMASVCGGSLSMMDAGVPLKAPVAGIAMGLVKEGDQFAVLTDILGDEDHLGDMDFKVAGTEAGVTALQMDIKIDGITREIMEQALEQAREGRLHILGEMAKVITDSKDDVSEFAPRITTMEVAKDKIRDVIGKGGATIRSIIEETGATIDINDDGIVTIAAVDKAQGEAAYKRIEELTAEVEVGKIYEGKVAKLMDFGAFVTVLPGKDGLVHVSQITEERVQNVAEHVTEGQMVRVKVLDIDRQGRIKLSMKPKDLGETVEENSATQEQAPAADVKEEE